MVEAKAQVIVLAKAQVFVEAKAQIIVEAKARADKMAKIITLTCAISCLAGTSTWLMHMSNF